MDEEAHDAEAAVDGTKEIALAVLAVTALVAHEAV